MRENSKEWSGGISFDLFYKYQVVLSSSTYSQLLHYYGVPESGPPTLYAYRICFPVIKPELIALTFP